MQADIQSVIEALQTWGGEKQLNPILKTNIRRDDARVEYVLHDDPVDQPVIQLDVARSEGNGTVLINVKRCPFLTHQVLVSVDCEAEFGSLEGDYREPMQDVECIRVDHELPNWEDLLRRRLATIFAGYGSSGSGKWCSVDDIMLHYRTEFEGGSFKDVIVNLRRRVLVARQLYLQNDAPLTWFAVQVVALAQILQQWGHLYESRRYLRLLYQFVPPPDLDRWLDPVLADVVRLVECRVRQPLFGTSESSRHLEESFDHVRLDKHKAKFVWRQEVDAFAQGSVVGELIGKYGDLSKKDPVCDANACLIVTHRYLSQRDHEAALFAVTEYRRQLESVLRDHCELPYAAVHGLFSGMSFEAYLHAQFGEKDRRRDFGVFLERLQLFGRGVGIGNLSDGMAELRSLERHFVKDTDEPKKQLEDLQSGLWDVPDLDVLCDELHRLTEG